MVPLRFGSSEKSKQLEIFTCDYHLKLDNGILALESANKFLDEKEQ